MSSNTEPLDKRCCCLQMKWAVDEKETVLIYVPKFHEYGIWVLDGGFSVINLNFCPWCGTKLPDSKRSEWFDKLEAAGIDPSGDDIPRAFQSDAWYTGLSIEGA